MCVVESERAALEQMNTSEYITQLYELYALKERHNTLLGIINVCTQTLDSLTDCLSVSGLHDLGGDAFKEWLCDIGMSKLQTALKDINGSSLIKLNLNEIMEHDISFNDATALHLYGFITHNKVGSKTIFSPPHESVLSWDQAQTAKWIESLPAPYSSLASAGWHGPALCSLSPHSIVKAGKGALTHSDANKFIDDIKRKRTEVDGGKDSWLTAWNGSNSIESHPEPSVSTLSLA